MNSRPDRRDQRFHLDLIHGLRGFAGPDDVNHPRSGQDRKPVHHVETAKHIAGNQGELDFLDAIRPSAPGPVDRQEGFKTLTVKHLRNGFLMPRPDP